MIRRYRHRWMIAAGAGCVWLGTVAASNAQVARYEPSRPTVSPYLNLFREQTGVLPNYQALVRPLQQQESFSRRQRAINQQNAAATNELQAELFGLQQQQAAQIQMTPTGKSAWFLQPGQRYHFMDTSRYYSQSGRATSR